MSISYQDEERLRAAGFTEDEIEKIRDAVDANGNPQPPIDLSNDAWRFAMESRREWIADKRQKNWAEDEIEDEIRNYYRRSGKRTPFDFLDGYKTGRRVKI